MRYYEHHLGDYLRDTAHLTILEDGAYRRLLDAYYSRERPLPCSKIEVLKLVRAITKAEKDAVLRVLQEFFTLTSDGYRQARADAEIAHFIEKSGKAKNAANARWKNGKSKQSTSNSPMQTHSERNADGYADAMHSQAPSTNLQSPSFPDSPSRSSINQSSYSVDPPAPNPLKGVIESLKSKTAMPR